MEPDDDFDLDQIIADIEASEEMDEIDELDVDRDFMFENMAKGGDWDE